MKKSWIIVISVFAALLIIGYLLFTWFGRYMYNCNECAQFNIDNTELRTGIDIPGIHTGEEDMQCVFDAESNTKVNYFRIVNLKPAVMDAYIERSKFEPLAGGTPDLSVFSVLAATPSITPDNAENFYWKTGDYDDTSFLGILDRSTGQLWISVKYK